MQSSLNPAGASGPTGVQDKVNLPMVGGDAAFPGAASKDVGNLQYKIEHIQLLQ